MTDATALCILRHNKPTQATDGLVCAGHLAGLREGLQDVLELFALLRLYLLPGSVESDGSKHTKAAEAPAPLRLDVAALSDRRNPGNTVKWTYSRNWDGNKGILVGNGGDFPDVPGTLEDWAGWVTDERQLTPLPAGWSITDSVRLLQKHLGWVVEQAMVDDLDESVRSLRRALAAASGERPATPVGPCPSLDGAGKPCGGPLWQDGDTFSVTCGKCERNFPEAMLRHLGGMMEAS